MDAPIEGYFKKLIISMLYKFFVFWFQLITNGTLVSWKFLNKADVSYYEEWLGSKESQEKEQM